MNVKSNTKISLCIINIFFKIENAMNISSSMVGQTHEVLVDSVAKKDKTELSGRTENNRAVIFKGDHSLIGQVVKVKINDVMRISLRGELVKA